MKKRCGILKYRLRPATIRCRSGTVANARRVEPPTRPVPPITSIRRLGTAADRSAPEVWQRTAPKHPIGNTPVDISLSPSSLARARAHTHTVSFSSCASNSNTIVYGALRSPLGPNGSPDFSSLAVFLLSDSASFCENFRLLKTLLRMMLKKTQWRRDAEYWSTGCVQR
jgi:hypothetical protein